MNSNRLKEFVKISKKLTILYIEDDDEARKQTQMVLENFFDHIDVAVDGAEGLEKYSKYHKENNFFYDLVITDINMPEMDGLDMCKYIFITNPKQHILVVSAYNDTEKLEKLIDIGVTQYMQKPVESKILIKTLVKLTKSIIEQKEEELNLLEIKRLNVELDSLVNTFDENVIASRTDLKGRITYASKAYEDISGYKKEELIGKPHNIVRHPDMPKEAFKDMWDTITAEKIWKGEVKNLRKDGTFYWVKATIGPYYDGDSNHIGYSAIRYDITAQKEVEILHEKVNELLNNADQGFLSFDKTFLVEDGSSKECLKIFGKDDILNLNIKKLLFDQDLEKQDIFTTGIKNVFDTEDPLSCELFLSLLPSQIEINNKTVTISYRILINNRIMVILTDITQTILLEEKIKNQNQTQKMIVAVASNKNEFLELKYDFEDFIKTVESKTNIKDELTSLLRELHTYKGLFAQKEMRYIVNDIHNLESKVKQTTKYDDFTNEQLLNLVANNTLKTEFSKDLNNIQNALGDDYLQAQCLLNINPESIDMIESKVQSLLDKDNTNIDLNSLIKDIKKLKDIHIDEYLHNFAQVVSRTAKDSEKYLNPLNVIYEKQLSLPSTFKPFLRSLVHLFNNCVIHGIEDIETRMEAEKFEYGTISCEIKMDKHNMIIIIKDDGAGINTEKLIQKVIENNLLTKTQCEKLSDDEKLQLIFADNISSKDDISTSSGRGVGMSAIKAELDTLNGNITLQSEQGVGSTFIFTVPLKDDTAVYTKIQSELLDSITAQVANFLSNDLGIKVLEQNEISEFTPTQYAATIDIIGEVNYTSIISISDNMIEGLSKTFIPEGFSQEENLEMIKDIPSEVSNIVVGLALKTFSDGGKDINISTPKIYDKLELKQMIDNTPKKTMSIKTTSGDLICSLINNEER